MFYGDDLAPVWDRPLLLLLLVLATAAVVVNVWTSIGAERRFMTVRLIRVGLGLGFIATYAFDLAGALSVWSERLMYRSLALASWILVWIVPAVVNPHRATADRLREEVGRRLKGIDGPDRGD